jgi:serine/threonine-protein kinase
MSPRTATVELPARFRLGDHVADGGMASVWTAEDRRLGRIVAIKVLSSRFLGDRDAVRRFQREARAAARVSSHPHVVTIFDVGEHEGRPFIVMEHMAGGSLADVLRDEPVPAVEEALEWLRGAAAALDFAHESGLVHRDVKPGNLLLDDARRIGVSDFGIARVAFDTTMTATGELMGTAAYLSPEQAAGEPAGPASDRYALAIVAYELLTGSRPYPGGSFPLQARQHLEAEPAPPSARSEDVPAGVDRVLLRGLDKDPEARWPTASAMVDALAAALRPQDADATAALPLTGETEPLARPAPAAPRRPPAPPPALGGTSGRRWAIPAAVAAGALALALLLFAALERGERPDPRPTATRPARTSPPPATTARARPAQPESGESVAALNDRGFGLIEAGRPADAVAPLQEAVRKCGDSTETVCAWALYNLGHALRLAGRPDEAIPVLERRLEIPNQRDVVARELELARRDAGAASGSGSGGDQEESGAAPRGKAKGKARKQGEGDD